MAAEELVFSYSCCG